MEPVLRPSQEPDLDGRYRLGRPLGQGGMATVYYAWDLRLGVPRAVKVLAPEWTRHSSIRQRFDNEARIMARLHHPHILPVFDVGRDGDRCYIVSELARGGSLLDRLARGPLRPGVACDVVVRILEGLHHAHIHGVVHRDVKPQNVLISTEGTPMVCDFGIAGGGSLGGLTRHGQVLGSTAYMAPEQRTAARDADARADVYAVGVTLYVLLAGHEPGALHVPDQGGGFDANVLSSIGPELAGAIDRATRRKREERYATAADMRDAIWSLREAFPEEPFDVLRGGMDLLAEEPMPSLAPSQSWVSQLGPPTRTAHSVAWAGTWILVGAGLTMVGSMSIAGGLLLQRPADPIDPPAIAAGSSQTFVLTDPPPTAPPIVAPAPKPPAPLRTQVATPAVPGRLYLNSVPWSEVEVDGHAVGRTGWTGEVPAGPHEVRFTAEDGSTAVRSVVVPPGGTMRICWDLREEAPCRR